MGQRGGEVSLRFVFVLIIIIKGHLLLLTSMPPTGDERGSYYAMNTAHKHQGFNIILLFITRSSI